MENYTVEKIEANFEEFVNESHKLDAFIAYQGKVFYHSKSIEAIADYIEEKIEHGYIENYHVYEFVDIIILESYRLLEMYARNRNLNICTFSLVEKQILSKLSVKTHTLMNEFIDDLIDETLDDIANQPNENPLNVK